MLWPSASEMLTSERITDKEKIAAEGAREYKEKI